MLRRREDGGKRNIRWGGAEGLRRWGEQGLLEKSNHHPSPE